MESILSRKDDDIRSFIEHTVILLMRTQRNASVPLSWFKTMETTVKYLSRKGKISRIVVAATMTTYSC